VSLSITPVRDARDRRAFLRLPAAIYADDPNYVFPLFSQLREFLDERKNPFFQHAETCLWLARRDGRVVGRVAACVDRNHLEHWGEQAGFFGFFECENDRAAAHALLDTARNWLRERGMAIMRGPLSFTTNHDNPGLLLEDPPTRPVIGMAYNPPYYRELLESYPGMAKCKDLWAWRMDARGMRIPDRVRHTAERVIRGEGRVSIRPLNKKRFREEVETIRRLYNRCWSQNWGFIPMSAEEFYFAAKEMKMLVNENLLLIAQYDGEPVGFSMTVPDFNIALQRVKGRLFPWGIFRFLADRKKIDYARTLLLGVVPEHRHRGLDMAMILRTMTAAFKAGIEAGECSWILEDNRPMNRILEGIGAEVVKTYRIYDLPLD